MSFFGAFAAVSPDARTVCSPYGTDVRFSVDFASRLVVEGDFVVHNDRFDDEGRIKYFERWKLSVLEAFKMIRLLHRPSGVRYDMSSAISAGTFGVVVGFSRSSYKEDTGLPESFCVKCVAISDNEVDTIDYFNGVDARRNGEGTSDRIAACRIHLPGYAGEKYAIIAMRKAEGSLQDLVNVTNLSDADVFSTLRAVIRELECLRDDYGFTNDDIKVHNYLYLCPEGDGITIATSDYGGLVPFSKDFTKNEFHNCTYPPVWLNKKKGGGNLYMKSTEFTALYQLAPLAMQMLKVILTKSWVTEEGITQYHLEQAESSLRYDVQYSVGKLAYMAVISPEKSTDPRISDDMRMLVRFLSAYDLWAFDPKYLETAGMREMTVPWFPGPGGVLYPSTYSGAVSLIEALEARSRPPVLATDVRPVKAAGRMSSIADSIWRRITQSVY